MICACQKQGAHRGTGRCQQSGGFPVARERPRWWTKYCAYVYFWAACVGSLAFTRFSKDFMTQRTTHLKDDSNLCQGSAPELSQPRVPASKHTQRIAVYYMKQGLESGWAWFAHLRMANMLCVAFNLYCVQGLNNCVLFKYSTLFRTAHAGERSGCCRGRVLPMIAGEG